MKSDEFLQEGIFSKAKNADTAHEASIIKKHVHDVWRAHSDVPFNEEIKTELTGKVIQVASNRATLRHNIDNDTYVILFHQGTPDDVRYGIKSSLESEFATVVDIGGIHNKGFRFKN